MTDDHERKQSNKNRFDIVTELGEQNELVLAKISEFGDEPTILGFLPLSIKEEDRLIETARNSIFDSNIFGRLRTHPAFTAYFLAISTSRCAEEGRRFWPMLMEYTGLDLERNLTRQKLATEFNKACQRLDLLNGTLEGATWQYAAPFFFQAGILHRWTDHIANGLKVVISQTQAPDLENLESVEDFIQLLCENSYLNGMANLKHTLNSAVGPLLIRSLVRAYYHSNWNSLPAHLRNPIRQAFNEVGRGAFIRVPYLNYNRAFDEIELVLPAQNQDIATFNTKWEANGHRFDALHETVIPTNTFSESIISVKLTGQNRKSADRLFDIPIALTETKPFKIFSTHSGREKRTQDVDSIDVAPDDYLIVMSKETSSGNDEDLAELTQSHKLLEVTLRPGEEPIELTLADKTWRINSIVRHGFYTNRDEAKIISLHDGEELFYDKISGIVAYFPQPSEGEKVSLTISDIESGLKSSEDLSASDLNETSNVIKYEADIEQLLNRLTNNLNPGIYKLKLVLTQSNKSISKEFWFWKGLKNINELKGFECDELPTNLLHNQCKGIKLEDGALRFQEDYLSPYILLTIQNPDQPLKIPRAGVQASINEPGYPPESINPNGIIVLKKGDKRIIQVESGGFEAWKIYSGNLCITTLNQKRIKYAFSLAGIAASIGKSGTIHAVDHYNRQHKLFSFSLPLSSSPPKLETDHPNRLDLWTFKVATESLHSIGFAIADLSDEPEIKFGSVKELIHSTGSEFTPELFAMNNGCISLRAIHQPPREEKDSDHARIKVVLTLDIDRLEDKLYLVEFYRKANPNGEWLPLQCDEHLSNGVYDSADLRFFAWGSKPAKENANFWQRLKRATINESTPEFRESISSISNDDLDRALKVITELLAFKYPSSVWDNSAHRIENFARHLSSYRFDLKQKSAGLWWKHASNELSRHASTQNTPVVRNFLFSTEPKILRIPKEVLPYAEVGSDLTSRCLMLPGIINHHKSKIYCIQRLGDQVNGVVPLAYKNCMRVHTSQDNDLRDFSLSGFLHFGGPGYPCLEQEIISKSVNRISSASVPLFTAEHLIICVRKLNIRSRKIQEAVNSENKVPFQGAAQFIEKSHQQIYLLGPSISNLIGWHHFETQTWTPPLLTSDVSIKVSHLCWAVAAIGRLAANGRISQDQFESHLKSLFCHNEAEEHKIHNGLNIILSLAPELFSCYLALFELSINSD